MICRWSAGRYLPDRSQGHRRARRLRRASGTARQPTDRLLLDELDATSSSTEGRFVKACDKLQLMLKVERL